MTHFATLAYGFVFVALCAAPCHAQNKATVSKDQVMKSLQGDWTSTAEEEGGKTIPKADVKTRNRRITIAGNKFTMNRVIGGKLGTYEGRLDINTETTPWEFNFAGKGPQGAFRELIGICKLEGDLFSIRYTNATADAKRPASFATAEGGMYFIFKRDKE